MKFVNQLGTTIQYAEMLCQLHYNFRRQITGGELFHLLLCFYPSQN